MGIHYCIFTTSGENKVLDLVSPNILPQKYRDCVYDLFRSLSMPLQLVATQYEHEILLKLASTKDVDDVVKLFQQLPLTGSGSTMYISLGIHKLIALWKSGWLSSQQHQEGWYQIQVYSDLLDSIFLLDKHYVTKRTECHASTIKHLKRIGKIDAKTPEVKVDLIIFDHQHGDIFTCEDKPSGTSSKDIRGDVQKGARLRESRLKYLREILPKSDMITDLEVLSAQTHGLSLTIYGSKMTENGTIVHYQKTKAIIPPNPTHHMHQAAHFLLTVLSLQRAVILNLRKLEIIFEAFDQDALYYLSSGPECFSSNIFSRSDSDVDSSDSEDDNKPSDVHKDNDAGEQDWMSHEKDRRIREYINKKIENLVFNNNEYLDSSNWEDFVGKDSNTT
ncbi:hypothetical protein BDA99DRAFT_433450 [Phascolomyces articulosus]|uniref:Uncharacterized protein n=1 Tax=Phascolomyces articulosus TaxID=60185 RepID=A0AAD5KNQ2_9FUNG|nr:hypothetical protein BDA99DRAFT_433450 [Phascolomyces articulosus]